MNQVRRFLPVIIVMALVMGVVLLPEAEFANAQTPTKTAVAEVKPSRAATTRPSLNNVTGTVTFTETTGKVKVVANITGLTPNGTHGFHIHTSGDMTGADLMSTGPHYDPDNHRLHGGPTTSPVHAGDLGNLKADATGKAMFEITVEGISLGGPKNDVIGKPVIIHAVADDLKSQPAGNAGARVAGGLIVLKP